MHISDYLFVSALVAFLSLYFFCVVVCSAMFNLILSTAGRGFKAMKFGIALLYESV